jgi:NitT/TauT family transport system substrate-binding protein
MLQAAAAALIGGSAPRRVGAAPANLKVGVGATQREPGLHLAMERGYFRDAALEIEIVQTPNVMQHVAQMAAGQIDVLFGGLNVQILNLVAQGAAFRMVAARSFVASDCGNVGTIYALKKKFPQGLNDLRVLKGKQVGVGSVVGFTEYAVDLQMEKAGLGYGSVEYVHIPPGQAVLALANERVDALCLLPESARALQPMMKDLAAGPSLGAMYTDIQYSFVLFSPSLLKTGRETGKRFLDAFFRAVREFRGGATPAYLRDYATKAGLDPDREVAACRDDQSVDPRIDHTNLQRFVQWAVKRKYAERPMDVSELVDDGFTSKA